MSVIGLLQNAWNTATGSLQNTILGGILGFIQTITNYLVSIAETIIEAIFQFLTGSTTSILNTTKGLGVFQLPVAIILICLTFGIVGSIFKIITEVA